jgi:hypothetical protein
MRNAAWLCAFHHWLCHEGGWTLERAEHGGYLWTNRIGISSSGSSADIPGRRSRLPDPHAIPTAGKDGHRD